MRSTAITCLAVVAMLMSLGLDSAAASVTPINEVQSTYLQHCGGCHGVQGVSVPRAVPSLRGQVGSFLCTPEGRAYLIRLPNVALSPISDRLLADVMNFVVFDLGGPSTEPPFTASEVAKLRKQPLTDNGLAAYRRRIVDELIEQCDAPASLRAYSVE